MSGVAPVWDPAADELSTTMLAAVFSGPGRALEMMTIARPDPGPGEVLVRVSACGLCHSDLHYLDHGVPTFKTPPLVLGHEISGTVLRVGAGVDAAIVGTSVLLAPVTTCGVCVACRTGRENICASQRMLGNSVDGGFAEFVTAPARDAFPIPPEVPVEEACIIADALTTAFHAVTRRARHRGGCRSAQAGARDRARRIARDRCARRRSDEAGAARDRRRGGRRDRGDRPPE